MSRAQEDGDDEDEQLNTRTSSKSPSNDDGKSEAASSGDKKEKIRGYSSFYGKANKENNIYEIRDLDEKTFLMSNACFTPKSAKFCVHFIFAFAIYVIIICSISIAIDTVGFEKDYGAAECDGDTISSRVGQLSTIFEYWSSMMIVVSIVTIIASCYMYFINKSYVIQGDKDVNNVDPSSDIREYNAKHLSMSRYCCGFNILLYVFLLIGVLFWFCVMATLYGEMVTISDSKNCTPQDTIPKEAEEYLPGFVVLIVFSIPIIAFVIYAICACLQCLFNNDAD